MPGIHQQVLGVLSSLDESTPLEPVAKVAMRGAKVSWNMRGAWLLQEAAHVCDPVQDPHCSMESMKVLVLLISLCATITVVICAFSFFREDREEQITPLCPQLVVKDTELKFRLPLGTQAEHMDVMDNKDPPNAVCQISMDWPDPFRGSPHGVAATVRLHKSDQTLATIVARNVAVLGHGLALCRTGCEIFGFVEPEGNKYLVRHRTGVLLLVLCGDFDCWDIEGVNPVGSKVCSMKKVGNECVGKVSQHVDAGLVLCALMATHVHRRLTVNVPPPWSPTSGLTRALAAEAGGQATAAALADVAPTGKDAEAGAAGDEAEQAQSSSAPPANFVDLSEWRSPRPASPRLPLDEPSVPDPRLPPAAGQPPAAG